MKRILIAVDSVGIDPKGHNRPDSVYAQSRFLFPREAPSPVMCLKACGHRGILVETDVTRGSSTGAIECALTYTSIFSGQSAVRAHGLMQGLGMKDRLLEEQILRDNLFARFKTPCLANAIFPAHLEFFGGSYAQQLLPSFSRDAVEGKLVFRGQPLCLKGKNKNGFAELFTLAEINQNVFVFAAREAGLRLRTWDDVRQGQALTSSMTHELESEFDMKFFGQERLPVRTPGQAAEVLVSLAAAHDFVFYKYQIPDLISHTGQVESAREVFETIETFVEAVLQHVDPADCTVIVTSDHGHLEQLDQSRGHPKSNVPTWYFGPTPERHAEMLQQPEGIFSALCASEIPRTHDMASTARAARFRGV
jgi:Metalloenzyme superfamily